MGQTSTLTKREREQHFLSKRAMTAQQALSALISLGVLPENSTLIDVFNNGKIYSTAIAQSYQTSTGFPTSGLFAIIYEDLCGPALWGSAFQTYECDGIKVGYYWTDYYPYVPDGATPVPTPESECQDC